MSRLLSNLCMVSAIGLVAAACHDVPGASPGASLDRPTAVELAVDIAAGKAAGAAFTRFKDLAQAAALVVTIEDDARSTVYDQEQIALHAFDDTYLSQPLSLLPGAYSLTALLVVDAAGAVLYAAPLEGSALDYLVADPLAIAFEVSTDAVTTVRPQVLSTAEQVPDDFGYTSFAPEVVERLDFLLAAFVRNEMQQALEPAAADIEVRTAAGAVLYAGTLAAATNQMTVPAGHGSYLVRITRPGYAPYGQWFEEAELAAYFDSAAGGPLEVVLHQASVLSAVEEQAAIATSGATDWEHFQIGDDHYLAVANDLNDSTYDIASRLYRLVIE